MPRIDFAFGASDRLRAACQLVEKHYLTGQDLLIYCATAARLSAFDRLLWAFHDTAFVPHVLASDPLAAETSVLLTATDPIIALGSRSPGASWLLNLDDDCPPHYKEFKRVLEIVSHAPDDRDAARRRWRAYQRAGDTPNSYDLSQNPDV
jgi:DNA polymerase-3 subunit chi